MLTKLLVANVKMNEAIGNFPLEHAGTIGAIAGLLALLPTPAAPVFAAIAVGASAASMAKNFSDPNFRSALAGEGSGMEVFSAWASLTGDFVGMFPGGKALGLAGKEVAEGLRYADEIGVTVSKAEKATEFTREWGHVFSEKTMAETATGTGIQRLAQMSPAGINVGANLASSAESLGLLPEEGAGHNTAETTKAAATAYDIAGILQVV